MPTLSRALGFSTNKSRTPYGSSRSKGISIALNKRSNKSKSSDRSQNTQFGLTSAVAVQPRPGGSDSTDEIIGLGDKAGIMVTRDIEMGIESHTSSPTAT